MTLAIGDSFHSIGSLNLNRTPQQAPEAGPKEQTAQWWGRWGLHSHSITRTPPHTHTHTQRRSGHKRHQIHSLRLPKRGEDPILLIAPTLPKTPLPTGASTPGCLGQWLTRVRTHRSTRTSRPFAFLLAGVPQVARLPWAFEGAGRPPAPPAPGAVQAARQRAAANARGGAGRPPVAGEGSQRGRDKGEEEGKRK